MKQWPFQRLFVTQLVFVVSVFFSAGVALAQSPNPSPSPTETAEQSDLLNPDRPGIADGSAVVGTKRFQLETGFQEEFRRTGISHEHAIFAPTLLRVGIDDRWEVRIEGNTFSRTTTFAAANVVSDQETGFAPLSFGFKYHIGDFGADKQTSLGTIVRVFPAWGTGDFRSHHVTGDVRLAADWNFAPRLKLSLNPNAGVGRYEDDQGRTFLAGLFAMTLNYQPTKKLNPFVDVGFQAPEQSAGRSATILDLGVAYILGHNVQLDASIGSGAHGQTPPHPFIGFGISLRSRPAK
jgi:Putative MetA-pathway of phenol degradation